MMPYFSFKRRFLCYALVLMLLLLLPGGLYLLTQTRQAVSAEAGKAARDHLASVVWSLQMRPAFDSLDEFGIWARGFQERTGIRLTFIVDGAVYVDSEAPDPTVLSSHAGRPEVLAATQDAEGMAVRLSETTGRRYIYVALAGVVPSGLESGTLRIAVPEADLADRLDALNARYFLVITLAFILVAILLRRLADKAFDLFDRMAVAAQSIAQGKYEERIPPVPCLELMPFTAAINGMADNMAARLRGTAEEKIRLLTVLNGLREGVILLDSACRIRLANPAAEAFFPGLSGMRGKTLTEAVMLPELEAAASAALAAVPVEGPDGPTSPLSDEITVKVQDHLITVSLIQLAYGENNELVLVFTDISERERVDRIRRDFVANISHELRTPLTSIRGYAEALDDDPDMNPVQRAKFCEIILRNAEHMTRMTDGLLTLARTEHAANAEALTEIDACAVLRDVLTEMDGYLREREIDLGMAVTECPEHSLVIGEPGALHEVFRNVIENAAKYGKGKISVTSVDTPGYLEFHIRDFGPGIPPASRERVFERFFRLDRATGKSKGSAGLGLAICRHIMRNIHGVIRIDDPVDGDGGVVFVLGFRKAAG